MYSFTVSIEGRGRIESSRDLVANGVDEYWGQGPNRILVTFRALPPEESIFLGWFGDVDPWSYDQLRTKLLAPELTVLMDRDRRIIARFELQEKVIRGSAYAVDLAARIRARRR